MPLICLHFSFIHSVMFMLYRIMERLIGIISDIITNMCLTLEFQTVKQKDKLSEYITVWLSRCHYGTVCSLHLWNWYFACLHHYETLCGRNSVCTPNKLLEKCETCIFVSLMSQEHIPHFQHPHWSTTISPNFPSTGIRKLYTTTDGKHVYTVHILHRGSFQAARPLSINARSFHCVVLSLFWCCVSIVMRDNLWIVEYTHGWNSSPL